MMREAGGVERASCPQHSLHSTTARFFLRLVGLLSHCTTIIPIS